MVTVILIGLFVVLMGVTLVSLIQKEQHWWQFVLRLKNIRNLIADCFFQPDFLSQMNLYFKVFVWVALTARENAKRYDYYSKLVSSNICSWCDLHFKRDFQNYDKPPSSSIKQKFICLLNLSRAMSKHLSKGIFLRRKYFEIYCGKNAL